MKTTKLLFYVLILSILYLTPASAPAQTNDSDRIDQFITDIMARYDIPGLAIGIVKGGEIYLTKGYGYKSIDSKEPLNEECLFHVSSVSKPFIGTAVMQLVEAGKINLEAPVTDYLPYFKLKDARYKAITIRHLLTHTSGLPDVQNFGWEDPQYDDGALTRYVLSLGETELLSDPGEKWHFSNIGYDVVGNLIAKVSRMNFEDYMEKYVLTPLDMKRSTFYKGKANKVLCTSPHIHRFEPKASEIYPYNRAHAPSTSLHSSAREMCHYAIANLNRGMFGDDRLLKAISFNTMWSPVCNASEGKKMGLSWMVCEREGDLVVNHSGGDIGFQANFCLVPKRMAAIVVLSNYELTPASEISMGLWDILNNKEPAFLPTPVMIPLGKMLVRADAGKMIQTYTELQKSGDHAYIFNEQQLDQLGTDLLAAIRVNEAIEVFTLNVREYPLSFRVYDHLANACMVAGDNQSAIENYEKSLEINPKNQNAIDMIKKIRDQISSDI